MINGKAGFLFDLTDHGIREGFILFHVPDRERNARPIGIALLSFHGVFLDALRGLG